jgi:DNA repair protein RadD
MELRPYQQAAIDGLYDYFSRSNGNPLVVMPTGTGKSVVIGGFVKNALDAYPDTRVMMLTHQRELIAQNFQALLRIWPQAPAGIYSAGLNKRDLRSQVLFAGIQSIYRRAAQVQRCDLVIIDEAHMLSRNDGSMYRAFLDELNKINAGLLKVVGFTATAYRMDSGLLHQGRDRLFTDIAYEVRLLDMIEQGYLSPVVPKRTQTQLDTSGVGTRGGEFIAGQLESAVDKDEITKAAVGEIVEHGENRGSWLVFCSGVKHAEHVRDAIREAGFSCETVTGETPVAERDRILSAFKAGRLRAVTNMGVLTTGFDAPGVDLIALLRPTKSVGLYVQMCGRGTRLAPGKEDCLVLDFAGNTARHGPLDMVDGARKEKDGEAGEMPVKVCPECETYNNIAAKQCVCCGYEFPPAPTQLAPQAATNALLSTQLQPEWVAVTQVIYSPHVKAGSPTSMRVTYYCGLVSHSEWVCFEHSGYARQKAEAWWIKRSAEPIPRTVNEALEAANAKLLREPASIAVRPVGKYTEIVSYQI